MAATLAAILPTAERPVFRMEQARQQVLVPVDQFVVTQQDVVLVAELQGSVALCLCDDVQDSGGLLHIQAGLPVHARNPELTDNTLSSDLLLVDRCVAELKRKEPRAKHWQARLIGHASDLTGGMERAMGIQSFIEACLQDAEVRLVSSTVHEGGPRRLLFRPSLAQLNCELC